MLVSGRVPEIPRLHSNFHLMNFRLPSGSAVGLQHMWNRSGDVRELERTVGNGHVWKWNHGLALIHDIVYGIQNHKILTHSHQYRIYIYRYCTWKRNYYTCDSYCHRLGGRWQHSNVWATFSQVLGTTYLDSLVDLWTKMSSLLVVLFDIMCVLFYIHLCIRSVYIYI